MATGPVVDVRPKFRPAPAVVGAGSAGYSTDGGFAALRVDLHSIEGRLAALRDRLETMLQADELAAQQLAQAQLAAAQASATPPYSPLPHSVLPAPAVVPMPQPHYRAQGGRDLQSQQSQSQQSPPARREYQAPAREPAPVPPAPAYQQPAREIAPVPTAPASGARVRHGSSPALSAMKLLRRNHHVNGTHTNGAVPSIAHGVFPNGAPIITNGPPVAGWAGSQSGGTPARQAPAPQVPVQDVAAVPEPGVSKLPTLADVRPAGRTEPNWIGTALRKMAPGDREVAGKAIVGLLPIQGDVIPDDVSYDLVISDGAYAVTVTEEEVAIQRISIPRPLASIDARIEMTLESLGALPTTKRVRALLRSGSVRVSGRHGKRALAALHQVAVAPVGLKRAVEAGVVLPENVLMSLVAAAIPSEWTIGHRFTICVETGMRTTEPQSRLFLRVNDGGNVAVNEGLPMDIPTATIRCASQQLARILLGAAPGDATLAGDRAPIMLLQGWVSRLESGRL